MVLYLVTFDLHRAPSPPGNLYSDIYHGIQNEFGRENFCRAFGQFCVVRSDDEVAKVKQRTMAIIKRNSNMFPSFRIVVFSVGNEISISRGNRDGDLRDFRRFFVASRSEDSAY